VQGLVQLAVRLTSAMPTAVQVRAVDIADVSTVDAADSRVLLPGVPRVVHVRVPVRDCAVPPAPQDLTWVVGPPRGDPAATFATPLDPADQRSVTVAAERACRPPATQVRAVAARLLPEDQVLVDPSGIGLAVRIRVVSPLARVSLGPDTGPLTADARTSLSHAEVRTVHGRGSAVVVWRTTCGPGAAPPPLLPVRFGDHPAYAVVLRDAVLARAYAEACRLSYPDSLRPQGWRAG